MSVRISQLVFEALPASDFAARLPETASDLPPGSSSLLGQLRQRFLSDEALAEMLQGGNADALTILFSRHSGHLLVIARRILRSESEAEDAVQQIFLDVFRSIHQFDKGKGTFGRWLMMFAYQRIFNSRRSLAARRFFYSYSFDDVCADVDGSKKPAQYSLAELSVIVEQALSRLQPRQRKTIELIYYEGLTAEEAAVRTGETVRVVRHNLYRGLKKLRDSLDINRAPTLQEGGSIDEPDHLYYQQQFVLALSRLLADAEIDELQRHSDAASHVGRDLLNGSDWTSYSSSLGDRLKRITDRSVR